MPAAIIIVENLGKRYTLGRPQVQRGYQRVGEALADRFRALKTPKNHPLEQEFWALRDVTFALQQGEVLGIIGSNGAGKSTLLKILSRITEPSTGRITLRGRVASLLEVGTGFHPELTGRENIFLNGAILGMTRKEIRARFDEIVAFAEVEAFLDTPVKRYSSGMHVRLAFAVAAHLDPEILVIDEVLAVGDAAFQKKCLGKMDSVAKGGRTVLFVSHNLSTVRQLTTRCVVLSHGKVVFDGDPSSAIEHYLREAPLGKAGSGDVSDMARYGPVTGAARFLHLSFGSEPALFASGGTLAITAQVEFKNAVRNGRFSITIRTPDSTPVCTGFGRAEIEAEAGSTKRLKIQVPIASLADGRYFCTVAMSATSGVFETVHDALTDVLHFELYPGEVGAHEPTPWHASWGPIRTPVLEVELSA